MYRLAGAGGGASEGFGGGVVVAQSVGLAVAVGDHLAVAHSLSAVPAASGCYWPKTSHRRDGCSQARSTYRGWSIPRCRLAPIEVLETKPSSVRRRSAK